MNQTHFELSPLNHEKDEVLSVTHFDLLESAVLWTNVDGYGGSIAVSSSFQSYEMSWVVPW